MKRFTALLLILAMTLALGLGACAGKPEEDYVIGVCAADLSNPYFVTLIDGVKAKAEEMGNVRILVEDPKQDSAKQLGAIENFVSQNVDGIIMIPFDLTSANEALKNVYAEGKIKILCQSGKIDSAHTNVSARDYDMGYALGEAAGKYIAAEFGGEAEVGLLNYPLLESIIDRENGIIDGMKKHAPNAVIVATAQGGTPDAGTTATEAFLQANPNLSVILSINDAGALGALAAVEGMNIENDKFFIGGIDALDQALAEIREGGYYRATVDITPFANGEYDLELMMKMLKGESVGVENSIAVKAVTAENIGEYN